MAFDLLRWRKLPEKSKHHSNLHFYNKCKCVEPFSGTYCGLGEQKIGVQVLIRDNFTSPTVIERVPMFKYEGHDYFIQDNDYL